MRIPHALRVAETIALSVLACAFIGCGNDQTPVAAPILFNFHPIEDGQAYRSSQLSGEALSWVIDRYNVKTVVNLRGTNAGKPWYDEEVEACRAKNVALVDLPMSSQSLPSPDLLQSIVQTLRSSQYPILIHCESGADRTGAVSALYRIDVLHHDRTAALTELSPEYWHFRNKKPCMDKLAEIYEPTPEWMTQYERDYGQLSCE